jgi:hypothetical protein
MQLLQFRLYMGGERQPQVFRLDHVSLPQEQEDFVLALYSNQQIYLELGDFWGQAQMWVLVVMLVLIIQEVIR